MLFDNFDDLLEIFVGVLMIKEPVGELLESLKEAVQVHLVIVTAPYHIFVNYIVVCL